MFRLYAVVYALVFILAAPYFLARGLVNHEYLRVLKTRFLGPAKILPKLGGKKRVWVWALSLGEVMSARGLVRELKKEGLDVVVSATTLSGIAMAEKLFSGIPVLPSPLDFRLSVKRFLKAADPDSLILVETDVWPGVVSRLKKLGIPASLVSARLSPGSFKNYRRIGFFWKKVLRLFHRVAVQTEEDRDMFLKLGADPESLEVAGNLKFDQEPVPADPAAKARLLRECGWPEGRYVLAGSTHTGEEYLILKTFLELEKEIPDLRLVVAPRDRHKFGLVYRLMEDLTNGECGRRTKPEETPRGASVFLLDTLGELEAFYALADIAVIGKSFPGPHEGGGHNPLEPAARGVPVLSGPRVHNFKWMYQALQESGAAEIVDKNTLGPRLRELLNDPEKLEEMGGRGRDFIVRHHGSALKTLAFVDPENFAED
ncbi:MAG: hypothetical protein LBR53_13620 [Deltaproteobacteria bacterium]|jgi:3-deoxy-D-manno-octulosonic-acid transferase|nr:hypothetical protein [Deltaproteobacteria bacterium]